MRKISIAAGLALAAVSFVALLGAEPSRLSDSTLDEICAPYYSSHQRMPLNVSQAIKRRMLPPNRYIDEYELDHIIPLCLGGSNNSSNLQLQLWAEANQKDRLEQHACLVYVC
jgi:5-methylcytosine-specific restriction endonuclease McrA